MDEATTITATQQQQLEQLPVKAEGLQTISGQQEIDSIMSSTQALAGLSTPIDLEKTPEFEIWKQAKLRECLDYLRGNWKMDITAEKLVMEKMYIFPDPDNRKAYASVDNFNYIDPVTGVVAINPATGQRVCYTVWRKIDPPAPEVEVVE